MTNKQYVSVDIKEQKMDCFEQDKLVKTYRISTAKNGVGEQQGSQCTPRGWHKVYRIIGRGCPLNSVFVSRKWTGEIFDESLADQFPERDWILSRIIQITGLEKGINRGGSVDSLKRYIYFHGTPESEPIGIPMSHGCIRMKNLDVIAFSDWVLPETRILIA